MIFILDTDMIVFMHRGFRKPIGHTLHQRAITIRDACRLANQAGHQVGLSVFSVCEMEYGSRGSSNYVQEAKLIQAVISPFIILTFDVVLGPVHYGLIRHALAGIGKTIGPMDLLIAAHALALSATLVTNNTAHFNRVPGLKTVNWS